MSEYERIKVLCLSKGELWKDPSFPTSQQTVFYHQTPPFEFVWKRPREIYTNPKFIVFNNDENVDITPGKLGDKWLASCLGILSLHKGLLFRVVPSDQKMDSAYAGIFRFRIYWCGIWVEVLVDDLLPTVNGRLVFMQSNETEQLWPALLEKAYAKLHGSYEALKYGSLMDGLADLMGGITEYYPMPDTSTALHHLLQMTSIVTAQYTPPANEETLNGFVREMNYKICRIEMMQSVDGPLHLVLLRKPMGPGEKPGSHVFIDQSISLHYFIRERLATTTNGYWILFDDFYRLFSRIEIVHLDGDTSEAEGTLSEKRKWQMKKHKGSWMRGVSAGGCRNYAESFYMNPQIQIVLSEPDTVVISLNQHSIMDPKVIGFSIYKLPRSLPETAAPIFFKKIKSTINSHYTNSRQVTHRCQLEAAAYLVMPTTFEPREEAEFTLRVFSNKPLKLKVLDHMPEMLKTALIRAPPSTENNSFSQYEVMFIQLADGHRTIDTFELQDLLNMCLPNDYIKSCATIETCRQIVLTMDKTGNGRITLTNFKDLICSLMHWQLVFKLHAGEKMGVVRVERLRDALKEVGFIVPERIMALLVLRYMRKDGMLRFGDFVSAVMHLHRAFSVFYEKDASRCDSINMNLSEWLKCTLTC